MGSYNPRTGTGIPTEPVGSLPRPSTLQAAFPKIANRVEGTRMAAEKLGIDVPTAA